jgi:hypothetical protein
MLARQPLRLPNREFPNRLIAGRLLQIFDIDLTGPGMDAADLAARAAAQGLHVGTLGPTRLRLVTHLDVDRRACERAVQILAEVAGGRS